MLKVSKNTIVTTVAVSQPTRKTSRYIPSHIRKAVWRRDKGQCVFINKQTGEMCGSRHFLEFEYLKPFALGGASSIENLRLLCRSHNQRTAINTFGFNKIEKFLNK